ncbi:MAG: LytTR family DNA-binding domain-containing protein [Gammaproteobacteria bacterium]|nr:LytTR family DNA-binding domain-containing protein [Gammaproteobacteria bacterium]
MKILIVDDEPLARARMNRLLQDVLHADIVGEAKSGKEALLRSSVLHPDVVLLDIRMPEMSGLETALHLSQLRHPPAVIFTTAFSEHALAAFEANAVDYLLKPIRRERLEEALKKAQKINRAQLLELGKQEAVSQSRSHISAYMGGNLQLVPSENIFYFQAEQKYVTAHHTEGQLLIDDSLKSLEDEYGERFLRVHRNSLVAVNYIDGLEKDSDGRYHICFRSIDNRIEVSRRMVAATRRRLKEMGKV